MSVTVSIADVQTNCPEYMKRWYSTRIYMRFLFAVAETETNGSLSAWQVHHLARLLADGQRFGADEDR